MHCGLYQFESHMYTEATALLFESEWLQGAFHAYDPGGIDRTTWTTNLLLMGV